MSDVLTATTWGYGFQVRKPSAGTPSIIPGAIGSCRCGAIRPFR